MEKWRMAEIQGRGNDLVLWMEVRLKFVESLEFFFS
jgi:hypothetical protein